VALSAVGAGLKSPMENLFPTESERHGENREQKKP
jgi:hypothetical protein